MLKIKKCLSLIILIFVISIMTMISFANIPEFTNTKDIAKYINNNIYNFNSEITFISTLDHTEHYLVWMEICDQMDVEAKLLYKEEKITYTKQNNKTLIVINFKYCITKKQYKEGLAIAKKEAKHLKSKLKIKTILNVHNFVINKMDSDFSDLQLCANIYSAAKLKKGVCSTYAIYIKKLLDNLNIQSDYVLGYVIESETYHMWNIVKINNQWYYLDVTMGIGNFNYKYFLTNEDLMRKERRDILLPVGVEIAKKSLRISSPMRKQMLQDIKIN